MNYCLTKHATARIRQRGFRERDIETVLVNGTETDDGVLLTGKDVAVRVAEFRRKIAQLERLRGTAVFVQHGRVVSVYRPDRRKLKRLIREGRSKRRHRCDKSSR